MIGAGLFRDRTKPGDVLKSSKEGHGPYMHLLAESVMQPDEIWVVFEHIGAESRSALRRRYISRFELPDKTAPLLVVFEHGKDGWRGITTFRGGRDAYLEKSRQGVRIYRRPE